jgi:hypothetical protein
MTPRDFFTRWAARLDDADRDDFMLELAALLTLEQARERRRLCTDPRAYRQAVEETAAEIRQSYAPETLKATA